MKNLSFFFTKPVGIMAACGWNKYERKGVSFDHFTKA
jgi:hypothetical protein